MKRLIIASAFLLVPAFALAAGGESVQLEDANIDLADKESLQRGARTFVNHCMGCHSLQYMRYNRMGEDLGLDEVQVRQAFIFDSETKPGDLMVSAMRPEDGEKWFGTAVPDLTLVTRWRDADWLYTYLKSFYVDESRPYGVNNAVFPDVGMPHVLAGLQGLQKAVYEEAEGEGHGPLKGFEPAQPGSMSADEYDGLVRDLTNFLTYAGEPMKLERQRLGVYVLIFLAVFFVLAYALKKEFWKDVH
jgi:ubiquinol-cytochrome c reductase cytochrome c1 subunit